MAGCVLMAQALAMLAYEVLSARSHELPWPLPQVLNRVATALGLHTGIHESTMAVFSMRNVHLFGATWELLVDPVTCCFLVGGIVWLGWRLDRGRFQLSQVKRWLQDVLMLLVPTALWLPIRATLLLAIFLHQVLRTDYDAPLDAMKVFWDPWILGGLLAGPLLLAWRFIPGAGPTTSDTPGPGPRLGRRLAAGGLTFAAVGLISLGVFWDPVGTRQPGRVLVEEFNPGKGDVWERTDKPFDTTWYGGPAAYTYYCIFDYCGHYYHVERWTKPLDDAPLARCDVLVLKVPIRPYAPEEVNAIERFVERGGGLLLIGEHTNVFNTGMHLNAVAERFGFAYRFDCVFGLDSVFEEHMEAPLVPHPALQYLPELDFAISCSIDLGTSSGRGAIRSIGLKTLPADYHVDNFYPQPVDSAEMRYGAFVQLWSMRHGAARVGLHRFHALLQLLHLRAREGRIHAGHVGMAQPSHRAGRSPLLACRRGRAVAVGRAVGGLGSGGDRLRPGGCRLAGLEFGRRAAPGSPLGEHAPAPG